MIEKQNKASRMSKFIDLSLPLEHGAIEPTPPRIKYIPHKKGANLLGLASLLSKKSSLITLKNLLLYLFGIGKVTSRDFPGQIGLAWETVQAGTHAGTHLDAPWHFGPTSEGKPSRTIDQVPLEWCYGDGVVIDLRHKKAEEFISVDDLIAGLKKINYQIKPKDIVLLMTGRDKHFDKNDYLDVHPGMSREATLWLVEKGVRVIGTDGWGFDRPFKNMVRDYLKSKDLKYLWPAHFAGREKEYCHLESMANLDQIPRPYGFKIICFPMKIKGASAGWVRPVAVIPE